MPIVTTASKTEEKKKAYSYDTTKISESSPSKVAPPTRSTDRPASPTTRPRRRTSGSGRMSGEGTTRSATLVNTSSGLSSFDSPTPVQMTPPHKLKGKEPVRSKKRDPYDDLSSLARQIIIRIWELSPRTGTPSERSVPIERIVIGLGLPFVNPLEVA